MAYMSGNDSGTIDEGGSMGLKSLSSQYKIDGERQIVITEVTRMTGGMVCVAGLDIHSGAMIRPLQPDGRNWEQSKWVDKDYMVVGNILSLVPAAAGSSAYPHASEDYRVKTVRRLGTASNDDLYIACRDNSDSDADSVFDNQINDEKYVVAGTKCRSLGCIMVSHSKLKASVFYDKIQVSYRDSQGSWHNFPVTDLTAKSSKSLEEGAASLNERISMSSYFKPVALRLGLSRAWKGKNNEYNPMRCYVQLNGIIVSA
ncbi:dual OB domain-containing protein [Sphingomonas sp. SORGH_AS_0438]|uniref:dual OB domain-containing protein n=1 Tax=Sphingomonas sp. SORGH_AS_0438 TaxID=3041756 RepID=UPI00285CAB02|nr:hypothetical protein [Sphingomonas sp. SORGH_AS_0438]MDR6129082.1 hypothetical protein [Sphingomonas sp. SORGH_AS_0438]